MREIRMLRATWRGLKTWHGRKAVGAPVLDPTCERPVVKIPGRLNPTGSWGAVPCTFLVDC